MSENVTNFRSAREKGIPGKGTMGDDYKKTLIDAIISREDASGCWNVLTENDPKYKYYKQWNHYVPTYSSTLWTMVLIADIGSAYKKSRFLRPLNVISERFYDKDNGIFTLKGSHFPIPCLNGNMLYLHGFFESDDEVRVNTAIDFFARYQRFDDGDYRTPSAFPYFSNKSCYGRHSCYWGIVKLLKGLSFIPKERRSANAKKLIKSCIDFILLHEVCHSSKNPELFISKNIKDLTFPNMYKADFLEILWILKREEVRSDKIDRALKLLESKMDDDGSWSMERTMGKMVIPFSKKKYGNVLIDERANEVYSYYFNNKNGMKQP